MKRPRALANFHWRLTPSAGSYATNPRWSNKDLDPVPVQERKWRQIDYVNYWVSDILATPLWATISAVVSLGLTAGQAIPVIFVGFLLCGVAVQLNGATAARYRVPYSVILRSSFGMWGAIPAIIVRAFVAMMWTAITIVQGGLFLENAVGAIWPSYLTLKNHFSPSLGITSNAFGMVMIYWAIQTCIALIPINKLRYFFLVKTIIVVPTFLALFIWAVAVTHGGGPLVTEPAHPVRNTTFAVFSSMNVVAGLFSSLAVNMPDFGRFSKNEKSGNFQFLILPVIGTLGSLAPYFVTSASIQEFSLYTWEFPAVVAKFESRAARFFVGMSFVIATIGNQVAAGSYPFSIDVSALAPRYFNVVRGTLFMAAFCLASNPWLIIKNAGDLLAFLSGYSCVMGSIAGIMLCNYYLVHKKKLDVGQLYDPHGIYRYSKGWNWRAYVAFFAGWSWLAPGFIAAIGAPTLTVPLFFEDLYSASWLFGLTVSGAVYYVLSIKFPQRETFLEHGVLPPQTVEEEQERLRSLGIQVEVETDDKFSPSLSEKDAGSPDIAPILSYAAVELAETGSLPSTPIKEVRKDPFSTTVAAVE